MSSSGLNLRFIAQSQCVRSPIARLYTGDALSTQAIYGTVIPSSAHFNAFLRACTSANELHKLHSALKAGWTEDDLADFARWHFGTPFIGLSRRKLMAIINSALSRDFFARRFLKEGERRPVSAHASIRNLINHEYANFTN